MPIRSTNYRMNIINKILKGDKVIWIVALLLGLVSLVVVYSATSALVVNNYGGDTGKLLLKHGGTLLLGYGAMLAAFVINYKHYSKVSALLLIPIAILLAYTLLFGRNLNDASRSISIFGFSFQPSEWAKIILLTYISRELVIMGDKLNSFKEVLLHIGIPMFAIVGLIFTENLSTAVILLGSSLVLLFIGRVKFKHILALLGIGVAALMLIILIDTTSTSIGNSKREKEFQTRVENGTATGEFAPKITRAQTWIKRIEAMAEPEGENYDPFDDHHFQKTYAQIAVATGNFSGKGPGKSEQRNFLPHPYSDFIFAIIIEEYGIFGALIVMLLYIFFFTRVTKIVAKRPLTFGAYMAFGLGFIILFQAMINMGVSVGLLPVTGQPLPLVSMGGTSMIATGFMIGMILSVTRDIENEEIEKQILESETTNEETDERAIESCD